MKTTIELNLNDRKQRQALRALIDILDDAPPEGLDISSGATEAFDPQRVNVWTSTEGAEMVPDVLNLNPEVDQVVTKTVEPDAGDVEALDGAEQAEPKPKKAKKPKKEADKPDPRKLVEAVVGVTTGKGTEVEGTAEEVAEVLDGEKIGEDTIVDIRKLQVKLAKYQALDEMKETIREVTGIKKGKLADIPAKFGDALIDKLTSVVSRLEEAGK